MFDHEPTKSLVWWGVWKIIYMFICLYFDTVIARLTVTLFIWLLTPPTTTSSIFLKCSSFERIRQAISHWKEHISQVEAWFTLSLCKTPVWTPGWNGTTTVATSEISAFNRENRVWSGDHREVGFVFLNNRDW